MRVEQEPKRHSILVQNSMALMQIVITEKPYGTRSRGAYLNRPCCVGEYPPNKFGLCDMHGNVWEWCSDLYREVPEGALTPGESSEVPDVELYVTRGGSWVQDPDLCRSACRRYSDPRSKPSLIGFRVACDQIDSRN